MLFESKRLQVTLIDPAVLQLDTFKITIERVFDLLSWWAVLSTALTSFATQAQSRFITTQRKAAVGWDVLLEVGQCSGRNDLNEPPTAVGRITKAQPKSLPL
ncbi:MAG: hypothetical protein DMF69_21665 [Acidobacteria bacterium]|nr:MAG: hypothetical protein DMF69_21665 [Acidobacteriota bacterium]